MNYPIPINEQERLTKLRRLGILSLPDSAELNAAAEVAANLFGCQFSLITLLDDSLQWFKARYGLRANCVERKYAFCNYTIEHGELLVVTDASTDERFTSNPYVSGPPGIRFYVGAPISFDGVHALGTFCILGTKPRNFSEEDRILFLQLKGIVEKLLRSLDRTHSTKKIEKLRRIILHNEQHDHLTGLANRSRFSTTLNEAIVQMRNGERNSAVMLVDLDGFKQVNDTFGYRAGDALLRSVSTRLMSCVRPIDFLARSGGDEFAIILASKRNSTVPIQDMIRRICTELELPFCIDSNEISIGANIGVSLLKESSDPAETAMSEAYSALNKIKRDGTRNYCVFDSVIDAETTNRKRREKALRHVVKNKEFILVYQPVYATHDNSLVGFEALIRWNSVKYEKQNPDEFIPMAEDIGLIGEIGEWVVERAIAEASHWQRPVSLALNVSPQQLGQGQFFRLVSDTLKRWDFPAERLELEITEYAVLQDDEATINELKLLKSLGAKIVLDDFGTGYSSFSYLHKFPFDKLKIDRSFIDGFEISGRRANIIRGIIVMSVGLGIEVTAEGVELENQLILLKTIGCNFAQGYLLGKPMSASKLVFGNISINADFPSNLKIA